VRDRDGEGKGEKGGEWLERSAGEIEWFIGVINSVPACRWLSHVTRARETEKDAEQKKKKEAVLRNY